MPTQEERLTIVEYDLKHFKTETIKAYGEIAMELVMVKGLTEDAVKRLMTLRTVLDQQMAAMKRDIQQLQATIDVHTTRLDTLGRMETLLTQILERLPEKP
jgi:hypothetical protein